jgi:hypothetical protein
MAWTPWRCISLPLHILPAPHHVNVVGPSKTEVGQYKSEGMFMLF